MKPLFPPTHLVPLFPALNLDVMVKASAAILIEAMRIHKDISPDIIKSLSQLKQPYTSRLLAT